MYNLDKHCVCCFCATQTCYLHPSLQGFSFLLCVAHSLSLFCLCSLLRVLHHKHSISHSDTERLFLMQANCLVHLELCDRTSGKHTGVAADKLNMLLRKNRNMLQVLIGGSAHIKGRQHQTAVLLVVSLSSPSLQIPTSASSPSFTLSPNHRPLTLPLYVGLSIPFFSAFTLPRALHFTGTTDERLGPSARADKTTLSHTHSCRYGHTYRYGNKGPNRDTDASLNQKMHCSGVSHTRALVKTWLCRTQAKAPKTYIVCQQGQNERKEIKVM